MKKFFYYLKESVYFILSIITLVLSFITMILMWTIMYVLLGIPSVLIFILNGFGYNSKQYHTKPVRKIYGIIDSIIDRI